MFINPSGLTVIVEETATSMAFRNGLRRRPARVHRRVGSLRGKLYFGNWRPSAAGPGRNLGSLSLRKLRKTTSLARINSDLELDRTSGNLPILWREDRLGCSLRRIVCIRPGCLGVAGFALRGAAPGSCVRL